MKKNSIFIRLFSLFLLFTLLIMGMFWVMQTYFYAGFYQSQKISQMKEYSVEINEQITENGVTEALLGEMEEMAALMSGRIRVLDYWGNTRYQAGSLISFSTVSGVPGDAWNRALNGEIITYKLSGHLGQMSELALLYPYDSYILLLQTPLQSIEESISITQQFSVYIIGAALLLSLLLAGVFSRTMSRPLVKLNRVAAEMAQLNFDVRWEEHRSDEIGELGNTINFLTDQLKKAFEDLRQELWKEKNLDKMRKQFVGRVSHEMQTPIALIRGYTEALQDGMGQTPEEIESYYEIIQEETHKMSTMVKDLLDLSQLESGHFKVKIDHFDITELIDRTVLKFQLMEKERGVMLQVKNGDTPLQVWGDEYRIEQVMNNLIHNAVKYAKENGQVQVEVREAADRIWIGVFNEGKPIPQKDINNIWESFFKGEERPGTGLGLAIVKNVLELHESHFGVENQETGVLFYFDLPKRQ